MKRVGVCFYSRKFLVPRPFVRMLATGALLSKKFKNRRLLIHGQKVFFSWKHITGESVRSEFLFVISNRFQAKEMLNLYAKRWSIEQMFSHWKKRGFDLEATHITNSKALLGLIILIALAYLIAHQWGLRLNKKNAIKKKSHGFLAKSIFRYGLDGLKHALRMFQAGHDTINESLKCIFKNESFVRQCGSPLWRRNGSA